jgi:murein DD-endopeptidase MepM/ murein hydrolase activator NlpD
MSPSATPRGAHVSRRRQHHLERRRRRVALGLVLAVITAVVVLVSAFGGSGRTPQTAPAVTAAARLLLPAGPPSPEIVARIGALHIQLPIPQSRVTAIGYQGGSEGAISLAPLGRQANQGLLKRMLHAIVGGSSGIPRWYQLPGGAGAPTSSLDVGAPAGTDVYSPVDGSVVGISDLVLNGRPYGSTIEIQPSGAPSLVVTISHVRVDPSLIVGSGVTAGGSKLGEIVDFTSVERQALARYTNDTGNHAVIEVHPSATLQVQ